MVLFRLAGGLALATVVGACTLLTPLDGYVSPAVEATDAEAGTRDGSLAATDAIADAAPEADVFVPPTNLHPNGDFETKGCDHWGSYQGVKSPADVGRTGQRSCRFCATDGFFFSADDGSFLESPSPGKYHLEGWIRSAPGMAVPAKGVLVLLRTTNISKGFEEVETAESAFVSLTPTWTKREIDLTVTKPAENLNAVFAGEGGPNGACFLLDDVVAYKLP